jgi:hypothetical protein
MDEDIFLADRCETVAAMLADTLGKARIVWRELQFIARQRDDF